MAVPKKRTGKAKQASRRAQWKGKLEATTTCPNCKELVLTHRVCDNCGFYKNEPASIKKKNEAVAVKETKAKKAKAVEATEVVETTEEAPKKAAKKTTTAKKATAKKSEETAEEKPKKAPKKAAKKEDSAE